MYTVFSLSRHVGNATFSTAKRHTVASKRSPKPSPPAMPKPNTALNAQSVSTPLPYVSIPNPPARLPSPCIGLADVRPLATRNSPAKPFSLHHAPILGTTSASARYWTASLAPPLQHSCVQTAVGLPTSRPTLTSPMLCLMKTMMTTGSDL